MSSETTVELISAGEFNSVVSSVHGVFYQIYHFLMSFSVAGVPFLLLLAGALAFVALMGLLHNVIFKG